MPRILYGNSDRVYTRSRQEDFDYSYPDGLDLKPGSELHDFVRDRILESANESASIMSSRFESWNDMDKFLTAYKWADEEEADVKYNDHRKPVSIVFPYSYAILETLLSYMMSAFFRDPLFRYEGYGPDDVVGSILLEKVIQLHCVKNKVMLNLHTQFRDSFVYGFGAAAPIWKTSQNRRFSGNALVNIDPYRYLPDPNVSTDNVQGGEFNGWVSDTNYMDLLTEELDSDDLFNVRYLGLCNSKGTSIYNEDNSARNVKTGASKIEGGDFEPVTEINMYKKLIPSEWNLGASNRPEKWLFRLAGDAIVTQARPADFDHNKFPISIIAPDFDGYSATPLSRLEVLGGLQGLLDFMLNSHVANVRKAINDTLIYDPYLVNSADLRDPKPGGLVRMRRPAWGQGKIADAVQQLKITDVTRTHIADSDWLVSLMQKTGATDDAAMGSLRSGGPERLTKAEFQGTASGAVSRLERIAKVIGLQGMQDLGEFFASHTQQLMDEDAYLKVSGDWQEVLLQEYGDSIQRGRMKVSPDDLDVDYDVVVRDGSIPGGNYSQVWMQMFEILASHPELAQQFDTTKIFKHIARNNGAKNVNEFIRRGGGIQPQAMPNEQVEQQVQKGNLRPV